jgi:hypothetical protein
MERLFHDGREIWFLRSIIRLALLQFHPKIAAHSADGIAYGRD